MPLKLEILEFIETETPITTLTTKFGGQPVWVTEPQWPIGRESGVPMQFICQIELDKRLFPLAEGQMAYVFMTHIDEGENNSEAESGENAVIIQPSSVKPIVDVTSEPQMNILERYDVDDQSYMECSVVLALNEDPEYQPVHLIDNDYEHDLYVEALRLNISKIGGTPCFYQGEEFPIEGKNILLMQLDDSVTGNIPFYLNFGCGTAYMFIDEKGTYGRMLWQC